MAFVMVLVGSSISMVPGTSKAEPKDKMEQPYHTIEIESTDGLILKADVYDSEGKNDPVILLFHQAGFSRGEYRSIAPKLNALGFTCIAIDQRSGEAVNNVINETHIQAKEKGLGTDYVDALPDLEATVKYAVKKYPSRKLILWGSSYSAALVFILGSEYKQTISGIIAYSPGEYFQYKNKKIHDYAQAIDCPVYITSARNEFAMWKTIFEKVKSVKKVSFIPESEGIHGAKALWESTKDHAVYWKSIKTFLKKLNTY